MGDQNLFSGSIIHMTKSLGIVPSCLVNSSKTTFCRRNSPLWDRITNNLSL